VLQNWKHGISMNAHDISPGGIKTLKIQVSSVFRFGLRVIFRLFWDYFLVVSSKIEFAVVDTVEPRYNKGPRDGQNMFAITRFFNIFYYYSGQENRLLYPGLLNIEVR